MLNANIKDNKLFIEIDLQEPRESSSGENLIIATSAGNVAIEDKYKGNTVYVGVVACIRKPREQKQ